jgi:hypothetical protein
MKVENTDIISARVSIEFKARLESLCEQYGFSINILVKLLAETFLRNADKEHNISEDLMKVIRLFENIPGWKKSVCLSDGIDGMEITEAFYVLKQPKKRGSRIVHVSMPLLKNDEEGWTENFNIQQQLERFMELTNESLYKHLRCLSTDLGTVSLLDTIHTIANLYRENPDEGELRLQFESNDWVKGAQAHRDTAFKRRNSHSMAYIEKKDMGSLFDGQDTNE